MGSDLIKVEGIRVGGGTLPGAILEEIGRLLFPPRLSRLHVPDLEDQVTRLEATRGGGGGLGSRFPPLARVIQANLIYGPSVPEGRKDGSEEAVLSGWILLIFKRPHN